MSQHCYLRAYMAGIALPTAFLLVVLTVFCVARFAYEVPIPIERAIVFPMALIPNIFGAWNVLYTAIRRHHRWNIGIHGALLPFLLVPAGSLVARLLGFLNTGPNGIVYFHTVHIPFGHMVVFFPVGVTVYYLVWKYAISFFNAVVGITHEVAR